MKNEKKMGVVPSEFLAALEASFPIRFDLNVPTGQVGVQARRDGGSMLACFSEEEAPLEQDWVQASAVAGIGNYCWLQPPFANVEPWLEKAHEASTRGAAIVALVPQGSQEWALRLVAGRCLELRLNPRMRFVGDRFFYPKDLSLLVFKRGMTGTGFWRWK